MIKSKGEPRSPRPRKGTLGGEQVAPRMETTAAADVFILQPPPAVILLLPGTAATFLSEQEAAKVDLTGRRALLSEENR